MQIRLIGILFLNIQSVRNIIKGGQASLNYYNSVGVTEPKS